MKRSQVFFLGVAVVLIVALYFVFKPGPTQAPVSNPATDITQNQSSASAVASSSAQVKSFNIAVKNKKVIRGPETITVNQGDQVKITITNDTDEEFHLHGYDKMVDLNANKPATLSFIADITGHFEYELEHSNTIIGALDVMPKQ